jgi:hypothetical protein
VTYRHGYTKTDVKRERAAARDRAAVRPIRLFLDPFSIAVREHHGRASLVVLEHDAVLDDDRPILTVINGRQVPARWPRGEIVPALASALYECWDLLEDAGFVASPYNLAPHPMFLRCYSCGAAPFELCRDVDRPRRTTEHSHSQRYELWPIIGSTSWARLTERARIAFHAETGIDPAELATSTSPASNRA